MGEHGWVVRRSINLLRMLLIEINTSREDHTALRRMREDVAAFPLAPFRPVRVVERGRHCLVRVDASFWLVRSHARSVRQWG